jgi:flavorubredoxin
MCCDDRGSLQISFTRLSIMSKLVVVYHSVTGTTAKLADAACAGIAEVDGARGVCYRITGEEILRGRFTNEACLELVDAADAVLFGCPTYMGGPSAQESQLSSGDLNTARYLGRRMAEMATVMRGQRHGASMEH